MPERINIEANDIKEILIGDGKYILIVESDNIISPNQVDQVRKELEDWWSGDSKFFILQTLDNVKVKFKRVSGGENSD